jgi:hypothetical protein
MSDLLAALKADLTSRRMLPLLGIAGLALLGALAYVALAAKSGSSTPSHSTSAATQHAPTVPGPAVSSAPANPNAAVSETTVGEGYQHGGKMRNPFTPLKSPQSKAAKSVSKSSASTSSASGSSSPPSGDSSPAPTSGGSGTSGEGSGSTPSTSIALYHVDVSLQQLSEEGKPVGAAQVFHNISTLQPLPSKHKALVAPQGVTGKGQDAVFVLIKPAILHGSASCVPNAGNCQAIEVRLHDSEELQYQQGEGPVSAYRLTVTKIEKLGSSGASASAAAVRGSAAGNALIAKMHLSLPSSAAFGGPLGSIVGDPDSSSAHAAKRSRHPAK